MLLIPHPSGLYEFAMDVVRTGSEPTMEMLINLPDRDSTTRTCRTFLLCVDAGNLTPLTRSMPLFQGRKSVVDWSSFSDHRMRRLVLIEINSQWEVASRLGLST